MTKGETTQMQDKWRENAQVYIKTLKTQRKRAFASAYLGYLEGRRSKPQHNDHAVGAKGAQEIINALTGGER